MSDFRDEVALKEKSDERHGEFNYKSRNTDTLTDALKKHAKLLDGTNRGSFEAAATMNVEQSL